MVDDNRIERAAEAYIYGYPMVYGLSEMADFAAGGGHLPFNAPLNRFGMARELLGPETKFVTPNNDTLYLGGVCDVRPGPLVLHVPDTQDRYYVLQFVDAWSNNFAYIGRRATGTTEQRFVLASSSYEGDVPDGMRLVRAPTDVFMVVGRVQVDGAQDLAAAHALQDQFTLEPLGPAPEAPEGVPQPGPDVPAELEWWERFRLALATFPPPAADAPFLEVCRPFGLLDEESPYVDADPALAEVLVGGAKAGQQKVEDLAKHPAPPVNGWTTTTHMFDYNLDHFEVGTIDSAEWRIADRTKAYVTRAVVARAGLWGNHGYEADYALVWTDHEDEPLDGSRRYELTLPTPPPVDAFWSLTMYDVPDFYLVPNPIDRYSIGDRTPGLVTGADGSVTIYLQHESPGPDQEPNWLPTPAGAFRPTMRMYQPRDEILSGAYELPAIRRLD